MVYTFRRAGRPDLDLLVSLAALAVNPERRTWLWEMLERQAVTLCVADDEVCAYGVLEHTFFGHAFIAMVYVDPSWRRRGAARALLTHLCAASSTPKVFSSTNLSNAPMHSLFRQLGWEVGGLLNHLDDGDPEVVYVRLPT
ncbi:GNAT family N-acetyltransferase [Deinococcus sp.]|uniref:GNAT family N-acetyltransferase n=1 Tax=Deinococcus sp. TaxID=47478 RepID=UPI0028699787|nr:GNAT family N-acetyltransferase [Deinococcus sp.]